MSIVEWTNDKKTTYSQDEVTDFSNAYRCHLAVLHDEEGGYSAIVLNLPGVGSCGDTESEAIENAREAFAGAVESFIQDGEDIPWQDDYEIPREATQRWILVNV